MRRCEYRCATSPPAAGGGSRSKRRRGSGGGRHIMMFARHRAGGSSRQYRARLLAHLAVVLPLGAAGLAAQALATAPAAQAAATTTFTPTGSEQTYTVPAGVTAVTIKAVGAPGGTDPFGALFHRRGPVKQPGRQMPDRTNRVSRVVA